LSIGFEPRRGGVPLAGRECNGRVGGDFGRGVWLGAGWAKKVLSKPLRGGNLVTRIRGSGSCKTIGNRLLPTLMVPRGV